MKGDKKHYQIAFNVIPQIDTFQENGFTYEEMKMINETKKIMHMPELHVAATCVRLPVEPAIRNQYMLKGRRWHFSI